MQQVQQTLEANTHPTIREATLIPRRVPHSAHTGQSTTTPSKRKVRLTGSQHKRTILYEWPLRVHQKNNRASFRIAKLQLCWDTHSQHTHNATRLLHECEKGKCARCEKMPYGPFWREPTLIEYMESSAEGFRVQ